MLPSGSFALPFQVDHHQVGWKVQSQYASGYQPERGRMQHQQSACQPYTMGNTYISMRLQLKSP